MRKIRAMKKRIMFMIAGCLTAVTLFSNPELAKAASSSAGWSVHVQPGNYQQQQIMSLYNHGNGYVAVCTGLSGDVSSMKTTITEYTNYACTKQVALNKKVEFTKKSTITFKASSMPSAEVVYMKALLTYSNGSTASMSGTVRTNN